MTGRETSPEISALASKYIGLTAKQVRSASINGTAEKFASDIRRMSASLLSQDETKGV